MIWSASRAFLGQWRLSPGQFVVLTSLHGKPSGCTQVELSRELGVSSSKISGLVGRLVVRGLIFRESDPEDKRIRHVTLTAEGVKLLDALLPHCEHFAKQSWAELTQERTDQLLSELSRLCGRAEAETAAPNPAP